MQFREAAWDEGQAGGLPGGGCTVRDGRSQERCSGQENCMCQGLGWGEVLAHGCTALGEADLAAVLQETRKDGEPASGSTMLSLGSGAWPHLNRAPASLA